MEDRATHRGPKGLNSLRDPEAVCGLLIHGDNQAALARLAHTHAGQVQAVYLDPPYNTGTDRDHYADRRAVDAWRAELAHVLRGLRPLLRPEAVVCVQIDDHQVSALWQLMDAEFGAQARLATVVVKMSELSGVKMAHVDTRLPKLKEYLLFYGNTPTAALRPLRVLKTDAELAGYLRYYSSVIDNPHDPPEAWRILNLRAHLKARGEPVTAERIRRFQVAEAHRVVYRTNNKLLAGLHFDTECARVVSSTGVEYIWWQGRQLLFLADHIHTWVGDLWTDVSTINLNKEGGAAFRAGKKPEALIQRVLTLCSEPGDLVLDAYAGSGTTAAVAHKLGRSWITIERGPHCLSHVAPRLSAVVAGTDQGGISRAVQWQGGGNFVLETLPEVEP